MVLLAVATAALRVERPERVPVATAGFEDPCRSEAAASSNNFRLTSPGCIIH